MHALRSNMNPKHTQTSTLLLPYNGITPQIHKSAFIAQNATIIGDTQIGEHSSVWYGCVVRGDVNDIRIGIQACVMDGCIVEQGAMVAAGALVTPGKVVRSGEVWAGSPAKKLRDVNDRDLEFFETNRLRYVRLAQEHKKLTL